MKKMLLVMAAGVFVAAGTAQAQSETVTSVNVVGYYSITIPTNGLALVTPVLESFQAGTLADLLGSQLPAGTEAFIWDRSSKGYISTSMGRGGWTATNIILRGDAVWLRPPAGTGPHTITFMGEVPGDYNNAGTTTVDNISGIDAVGYSYPIDIDWTNTALSIAAPAASELLVWNIVTQGYDIFSKGRAGWSTPASYKIKAGQGFWIRSASPLNWEEVTPYDL